MGGAGSGCAAAGYGSAFKPNTGWQHGFFIFSEGIATGEDGRLDLAVRVGASQIAVGQSSLRDTPCENFFLSILLFKGNFDILI